MPGLDVYYAAGSCHLDKTLRERTVFESGSTTRILLKSAATQARFEQYYQTESHRMQLLVPGAARDRRAPKDATARRKTPRESLGIDAQELALLFVASDYAAKGLDRAITALAHTREAQPSVKARLLVVGQDKPRRFKRLAKRLGVVDEVEFLGGRDDVADLLLAADLLVHTPIFETAGTVRLEAIAAGLPVVATDESDYASHVTAARADILLDSPFSQAQLDSAVMRNIDEVFRAECRRSALLYAGLTDLYSMHSMGADLMVEIARQKGAQ